MRETFELELIIIIMAMQVTEMHFKLHFFKPAKAALYHDEIQLLRFIFGDTIRYSLY